MSARKRIVITGGTGFVGRALVSYLNEENFDLHLLTRRPVEVLNARVHAVESLSDFEKIQALLESIQPHFVIHLASLVSPGRQLDDIRKQIHDTIEPAAAMAMALPSSVELAVFIRSADEYKNGTSPYTEEHPLEAISTYGWAKMSSFHLVELIAKNRNLPVSWVRPFLVFGPGQIGDRFIPTVIRGCLDGKKVALTPCEQTRDFIYVKDVCVAIHQMLSAPKKAIGKTFNLSSEHPRTLKEVATSIRDQIGSGVLDFGAIPYRKNEIMDLYGTSAKFRSTFGELALTPFEEALRETISAAR